MGRIRKISKIEYIKEEIKDIDRTTTYIMDLEFYTYEIILKYKLYDEKGVLKYLEIDIKELKIAYINYKKENNDNKIEEIEQLLRIAEELNNDWLIVDCN